MLTCFIFLSVGLNICINVILQLLLREGSMHAPLDATTYLGLHIMSLTDDLVPAMASLLRGMPNLKTLYINSYPSLHIVKRKVSERLHCLSLPLSHTKYLILMRCLEYGAY